MAKKTTTLGAVSDINVTPMVDVMLVLLIIFMVITPMLQKGVSVDMAKATNTRDMQDADKEDAVVMAITRDGKIYLGSDLIAADQITTKVKDRIANKLDKTVYVKKRRAREVSAWSSVWWTMSALREWTLWGSRQRSGSTVLCPCRRGRRDSRVGVSGRSARLIRRRVVYVYGRRG